MNHFKETLVALSEAEVDFIICGGVAMVLHGVERATLDLDLSVSFVPENLRRFIAVIRSLELSPRIPVEHEFILDAANIERVIREKNALVFTFIHPHYQERQVDVFLTEELSYDNLFKDSEKINIYGYDINLLSKRALLRAKQSIDPPRDKDLFDIKQLLKLIERDEDKL